MLKVKYLHGTTYPYKWETTKFKRGYVNFFSDDLPKHQKMRYSYSYFRNDLDASPLYSFLYSKVGEDWNDIYSEILTKIKKKLRYNIDIAIGWFVIVNPIYDENYIPMNNRGRMIINRLFVDLDNKLSYKDKDEVLRYSRKILRELKLKQLLENIEKNIENSENVEN